MDRAHTDVSNVPRKTRFLLWVENILYIAAAVILAALIQAFVIRPFIVSGSSMDPTFKHKQYLIIDEISFRAREPRRGEVIVFRAPPEPSKFYIKRIIGLPGETLEIKGSTVTIFNKEHPKGLVLDEPYVTHESSSDMKIEIPEGSYFVMGDNRAASSDSRVWGTLPLEEIRGRALLRLLPFSEINYLPGKTSYDESN